MAGPHSAQAVGRCRRSLSPSIRSSCSSEKLCTSSTATAPGSAGRDRPADGLGGEQRQRRADGLAAAALRRPPVGVAPAEVVRRDEAAGRVEPPDGLAQRRLRHARAARSRHGQSRGHAATPRSRGPGQYGASGRVAAAHRTLHRGRPSGVGPRAGQEQSGGAGLGRGPQRRLPGSGRNVASRSRVTKKSTTVAARRPGSSVASSGSSRSRSAATGRSTYASAADSETARYCPLVSPEGTVRSNTHWIGEPTAGDERFGEHPAVVDDVDVDDRRRAEPRRPAGRGDARRRRRQRLGGARRRREHDLIRGHVVDRPAAVARLDPGHLGAGAHGHPGRRERGRRGIPVQSLQRHPRPADVGGAAVGEQPDLEHHRGQRQRGVVGPGVQGRDAHQVPQRVDGARVLALAAQPGAEAHRVDGRVGAVHLAHGQRGPDEAQPLGRGERAVPQQGGAEVQRRRQAGAAQTCRPPGQRAHRDVQPVLEVHLLRRRPAGSAARGRRCSSAGTRAARCRRRGRRGGTSR